MFSEETFGPNAVCVCVCVIYRNGGQTRRSGPYTHGVIAPDGCFLHRAGAAAVGSLQAVNVSLPRHSDPQPTHKQTRTDTKTWT